MIGKTISHYKILEKLGEGGMGEVYLAQDTKLNRRVALKFLPAQYSTDKDLKARFAREAQAAATLNHPNIITVYEVSEYENRPFIAMEYVEGESLKDLIARKELSIGEMLEMALQISDGLAAAHEASIVHRDVKPQNILMGKDGRVRICDFGLAKAKRDVTLTQAGSTLGTIAYMSPEQAQGKEADHRSDIFSFGVVLYEMVTAQLPFKGEHEAAVINSIVNDTPEPLARYKADVPEALQRIVGKAMDKSPEMRYQHADDLGADLRRLKTDLESGVTKTLQSSTELTPSIAVLPFANLSADPEQEYFCDGMAEDIINALTQLEGLRVVARTSAFAFKGKHEDIREIGRKLSVGTLLEGSVRKVGERVRITAQLVKVADGYHLWSEKYDRNMEDIFDIQDEISLAIVDNLKVRLFGKEKASLVKRPTDDVEAYNLYLKGIYFSQMWTVEGFENAIECFEQALQKDPNYALAYAGVAEVYFFQPYFVNSPPKEAIPKAKAYLKKALDIDEKLAEAHAILGRISFSYDWNWIVAGQEFKRALELNPNSSIVHLHYGDFLSITGRHEEAIVELKRSRELDPLSINMNANVGERLYLAGQFDDAIEDLQKTITMDPNWFYSHALLGLSYLGKSMSKESIAELEKAVEISGGNPWAVLLLGISYYIFGKKPQAEKLFNSLKERAKHEYVPPTCFFMIHRVSGDMDQALKWLERACEDRDIYLPYYLVNPEDIYRIPYDQSSTELLKKVGLIK